MTSLHAEGRDSRSLLRPGRCTQGVTRSAHCASQEGTSRLRTRGLPPRSGAAVTSVLSSPSGSLPWARAGDDPVHVGAWIDAENLARSLTVDVVALGLGTVAVSACYGLLGVALGALTRKTLGAILGGLAWVVVVELAILQPTVPALAKWLPTGAGVALTRAGAQSAHMLPPVVAALVLVGWAVAVCLVASVVSLRREVR